jgi:hypothetical protein
MLCSRPNDSGKLLDGTHIKPASTRACQRDTNLELSTYSLNIARSDEQGHEGKDLTIW